MPKKFFLLSLLYINSIIEAHKEKDSFVSELNGQVEKLDEIEKMIQSI